MPILLPAQPETLPLEQGDVLADIQTFVADYTLSEPAPVLDEGLVLVISRPCNALRAKRVVVAEVVKRTLSGLKGAETLRQIKDFFATVRDGDGTPDTFYLGELEPGNERYFAKLDSLRTVQIPDDDKRRQEFIKSHRRFKLNPEFARDLHVRLFHAFARLGFDDDAWWTNSDLDLVARKGAAEVAALQAHVQGLEAQEAVLKTSDGSKRELKQVEEQLKERRPALASAQDELEPILRELERRGLWQAGR